MPFGSLEVVALDQLIAGVGIAHLFDGIETPEMHPARRTLGFVIAEPGQLRHWVMVVFGSAVMP